MTPSAFETVLFNGPMLRGDVIVVLCGEDGQARADTALQCFAQRAGTTLLLSGGRHEPPAVLGARHLGHGLIERGVAPDRILVDDLSQNTWEQATNVLALADQNDWHRLLLVASSYHLPRAYLTFVARLDELGRTWDDHAAARERFHILPVPAWGAWWQPPPGGDRTRLDLWHVERAKIAEYGRLGHCATEAEGLAYLKLWEGK